MTEHSISGRIEIYVKVPGSVCQIKDPVVGHNIQMV